MIFKDINGKRIKEGHVIRCNGGGPDFYFEVVRHNDSLCARMFEPTAINHVPLKYYAGVSFVKCEIIWDKNSEMKTMNGWAQIIFMPSLKRKIVCAVRAWPYKKGSVCDTPCTITIDKKYLEGK